MQGGLHRGVFRRLQGFAEQRDLLAFLHGKGQPAFQLGIELVFTSQVHRAVQQRAGRRHPQPLAQAFVSVMQQLEYLLQIAAPDVAPVDHAQRQHFISRQPIENGRVLLRRTHQVDMQTVHRQVGGQTEVVFQAAKIGGDQLLARFALNQVVGALEGVLPRLRQIEHQNRLVDLHPLHTLRGQTLENLAIDQQQTLEQFQLVKISAFGLAQPQVGQRADQHRFDVVPKGMRLSHFLE
ncbi:hypothetical protein N619_19345 [Ectopseudomonas oleovorans]|nr:hypothetical protein N619_19345 [Pseudomonas oleovorans]